VAGVRSGDLSCRASAAFRALVEWDVCGDYTQYLKKLPHVSPQCELVRDEERLLVAIAYSEGAAAAAQRAVLDAAIGGSTKTAAMSPAALAASAQNPTLDVRQRDAFLYGQIEADATGVASLNVRVATSPVTLGGHMYRALESCCIDWLKSYRNEPWRVRLYYRRPSAGTLTGQGLVGPITLVWDEPSLLGWSHKTGLGCVEEVRGVMGGLCVELFRLVCLAGFCTTSSEATSA